MKVSREFLQVLLAIAVPVAGAMGYMHKSFVQVDEFKEIKTQVKRMDSLMCAMAIKNKLENAVEVCTDKKD